MLILMRKAGESIIINDDIEITIVRTKDDKVHLGVTAPKETLILRKEAADGLPGITVDDSAQIIQQLSKELQTARIEATKYKSLLHDLFRSEWNDVTQKDLDEARQSDFDANQIIQELMQGSAA